MKKKMMVNLLVSSAVVGTGSAPPSTQAVTIGNAPITIEFAGGMLPDGNSVPNIADPSPTKPNSSFGLPFIPRKYDSGKLLTSDGLTKPIPNKADEERAGDAESVDVGDTRGSKGGWHVTVQSTGMELGKESLEGDTTTETIFLYPLIYNEETEIHNYQSADPVDPATKPETVDTVTFSVTSDGDAVLLMSTTIGKGRRLQ